MSASRAELPVSHILGAHTTAPTRQRPHDSAHTAAPTLAPTDQSLNTDSIQEVFCKLEMPFDPPVKEWQVTNTTRDKGRGRVVPCADQRAYTDRLNVLFSPAGWTRKYSISTSPNFARRTDE